MSNSKQSKRGTDKLLVITIEDDDVPAVKKPKTSSNSDIICEEGDNDDVKVLNDASSSLELGGHDIEIIQEISKTKKSEDEKIMPDVSANESLFFSTEGISVKQDNKLMSFKFENWVLHCIKTTDLDKKILRIAKVVSKKIFLAIEIVNASVKKSKELLVKLNLKTNECANIMLQLINNCKLLQKANISLDSTIKEALIYAYALTYEVKKTPTILFGVLSKCIYNSMEQLSKDDKLNSKRMALVNPLMDIAIEFSKIIIDLKNFGLFIKEINPGSDEEVSKENKCETVSKENLVKTATDDDNSTISEPKTVEKLVDKQNHHKIEDKPIVINDDISILNIICKKATVNFKKACNGSTASDKSSNILPQNSKHRKFRMKQAALVTALTEIASKSVSENVQNSPIPSSESLLILSSNCVKPNPTETVNPTAEVTTSVPSTANCVTEALLNQTCLPIHGLPPRGLRPIAIDGPNVARCHGKSKLFSCKGIYLCVEYFMRRGHDVVKVFIPKFLTAKRSDTKDIEFLNALATMDKIVCTPSRTVNNQPRNSYDDRFVLEYAACSGAVIVSNDQYRDIKNESPQWCEAVDNRLLMYTFVDDLFMVPQDPLGKYGPKLNDFLRF